MKTSEIQQMCLSLFDKEGKKTVPRIIGLLSTLFLTACEVFQGGLCFVIVLSVPVTPRKAFLSNICFSPNKMEKMLCFKCGIVFCLENVTDQIWSRLLRL